LKVILARLFLASETSVEKPCEIQRINGKPSDEWHRTPDELNESLDKIS